jgi:hypothetical protein
MATTDCAAIKALLDQAIAARTLIATGGSVRSVTDSDGSRVEYNAAKMSDLNALIAKLQAEYDACNAGSVGVVATRPTNFFF